MFRIDQFKNWNERRTQSSALFHRRGRGTALRAGRRAPVHDAAAAEPADPVAGGVARAATVRAQQPQREADRRGAGLLPGRAAHPEADRAGRRCGAARGARRCGAGRDRFHRGGRLPAGAGPAGGGARAVAGNPAGAQGDGVGGAARGAQDARDRSRHPARAVARPADRHRAAGTRAAAGGAAGRASAGGVRHDRGRGPGGRALRDVFGRRRPLFPRPDRRAADGGRRACGRGPAARPDAHGADPGARRNRRVDRTGFGARAWHARRGVPAVVDAGGDRRSRPGLARGARQPGGGAVPGVRAGVFRGAGGG